MTTIPTRWQRSRKAGARQPDSCKYVGRGTVYGNRHKVQTRFDEGGLTKPYTIPLKQAHENAVEDYLEDMSILLGNDPAFYDDLLNYEYISCFCPLDMPCHCDAIIEYLKRRYERIMK
jgi:hypothetical protein